MNRNQGEPLPVLIKNKKSRLFELDEEALSSILLDPLVADKHVCVVAVAGAFRTGKSFLLDFLLRYSHNRDSEDWLGDPKAPLTGFKWEQGRHGVTTGIMMWSKPFIVKKKSGEEVAVILVDTQGTFDTKASMKGTTVVFSVAMMMSSVFVYNFKDNIQEDHLMNLQTFTSYGMMVQEASGSSHAFQSLHFLVRDWQYPNDEEYGYEGGNHLLNDVLQITEKQDVSNQDVRRDLRKCFRDINCCLMPCPASTKVINKPEFDGRLEQLEQEFTDNLRVLVLRLLAPEKIIKKEFGGQPKRAKDLFKSIKMFMEVIKKGAVPDSTTLFEYTVRESCNTAVDIAKKLYIDSMDIFVKDKSLNLISKELYESFKDRFVKNKMPHLNELLKVHEEAKEKAVASYHEKNKFGKKNQRIFEEFHVQLIQEIDRLFISYQKQIKSQVNDYCKMLAVGGATGVAAAAAAAAAPSAIASLGPSVFSSVSPTAMEAFIVGFQTAVSRALGNL